jgi:hypothetical protein
VLGKVRELDIDLRSLFLVSRFSDEAIFYAALGRVAMYSSTNS